MPKWRGLIEKPVRMSDYIRSQRLKPMRETPSVDIAPSKASVPLGSAYTRSVETFFLLFEAEGTKGSTKVFRTKRQA